LKEHCAKVDYNDPHIPKTHKQREHDLRMKSKPLSAKMLASYDCVLIATDHSSYDYPRFNLSIEQIANGKFKPKINFEGKIPKGKVIWFANGEPVSVDPYFILDQNFSDPTYKLSAQFITDKGRRWFSEIMVNTRDYTNTDIPLEPFNDQNRSRLWHFDNSLTDSKDDISLHFKGNAKFDQSNLFWILEYF
jgi:hypothetical protein